MITLSNGHAFQYVIASGALGFDGRGYWFNGERLRVRLGLIRPELFTVVIKTLTRAPRRGNLRWWCPWRCCRYLPNKGFVNKVGLTNRGIDWWLARVAPRIDFNRFSIVGSIFGDARELACMADMLSGVPLKAIEVNVSCPNHQNPHESTDAIVQGVQAARDASRHPIIVKVSVAQDIRAIAAQLAGSAEAIALNSVPWEIAFPNARSPLWRLERAAGGGGGGVSGRPAQAHNWHAVRELLGQRALPVIAPDIMDDFDFLYLKTLGAHAYSFGTIHLYDATLPTHIVLRAERAAQKCRTQSAESA